MTTHLTDDELVLHYYGEMPDADEQRAVAHLANCTTCQAGYRKLQRVLAMVDQTALAGPELSPSFERTLWARLEPDLRRDRAGWFSWFVFSPGRLAWVAMVVVLVGAAFVAGRLSPRSVDPAAPGAAAAPTTTNMEQAILLSDLTEHLDRSQMMLTELANAGMDGNLSAERERAEQLVAANRLYRRTAETTGNGAIVSFLDELERLLVELAASPEQMSAEELASMRRRIDAESLIFKIRALSSEIRARQKSNVDARTGQRSTL
jgi:hypothetical protein